MNRILVFGSKGMLGSQVVSYLSTQDDCEVRGLSRFDFEAGVDSHRNMKSMFPNFDFIINCLGVIRPDEKHPQRTIIANALFPHDLVKYLSRSKVIHISTDCVFSGKGTGGYDENDPHDGSSLYAKTKSIGEPPEAMVIRTSIIGEEPHSYRSLVSWAKSQKGRRVDGYVDHLWNGMTTNTLAVVLHQIVRRNLWREGVNHVFSDTTTKADLLRLISERYDLNLIIKPTATEKHNMALCTAQDLMHHLKDSIPPIAEQITELGRDGA